MTDFARESLLHCPVHGYIPFLSIVPEGETSERRMLDHPWVQRMRQIHQLQTAWWVYPSAEHTRFPHVVGAMHMASRAVERLYPSLREVCRGPGSDGPAPSRGYVEVLCRMAGLLHDVGHGPFGHFFDSHYLKPHYGLTHETLGAHIIEHELGGLLRGVRECPGSRLEDGETLDPAQIAFLIQRPRGGVADDQPRWLRLLQGLFCGLYTVDNMDFVLRDAYMSGYSKRAYDVERLLRYTFFSERGLTIHQRGVNALVRFIETRSELFRAVYFHRTVRAIDMTLAGLFADSRGLLFPGDPREHLDAYRGFTEWSLLVDVARWSGSADAHTRRLGERWDAILRRQLEWEAVEDRSVTFGDRDSESTSVFGQPEFVEHAVRKQLPPGMADLEMRVDLPRHLFRPNSREAARGHNFLFYPATGAIDPLTDDQLFAQLPVAHRACRVYLRKGHTREQAAAVGAALDAIVGSRSEDDLTNM